MLRVVAKLLSPNHTVKRFQNQISSSRHGLALKYRPFLGTSVIVGTYLGFLLLTDYDETPQYYPKELDATLFRRIPLNGISRLWGKIAVLNIPEFLRPVVYGSFAKFYECNLEELDNPNLKCYSSLSEFFVRRLAPGVRNVDSGALLVSPVDGQVLHFGQVASENPVLEQVKGTRYSLTEFLGPIGIRPSLYTKRNKENSAVALYQCVIYLAPGDCHRFYSPVDWKPTVRRHFPGRLLSVRPSLVSRLPGLYALNERVVYLGEWMYGMMSLTAVGALGVGNISVNIDPNLSTNKSADNSLRFRSINSSDTFTSFYVEKILHNDNFNSNYNGQSILKGEEFGQFRIGSTIVLVFEAPLKKHIKWTIKSGEHVKLGQALLISS